jgi:hypothetical protein
MYSNMVSFIAYIELKCTMVAIKGDNWQCENCRCNKYCLPTSHKILLSGAWETWWRGTVQSNTPMLYGDALLPSRQRKSSQYVMTSVFFGTVTAKWCHSVDLNLEGPHCTGPNRLTSAIYRSKKTLVMTGQPLQILHDNGITCKHFHHYTKMGLFYFRQATGFASH